MDLKPLDNPHYELGDEIKDFGDFEAECVRVLREAVAGRIDEKTGVRVVASRLALVAESLANNVIAARLTQKRKAANSQRVRRKSTPLEDNLRIVVTSLNEHLQQSN